MRFTFGLGFAALTLALSTGAALADAQRTTLATFAATEGFPAPLAMDANGVLYGELSIGGPNLCSNLDETFGCGQVFRLTPPLPGQTAWTEDMLHAFAPDANGSSPNGGLTITPDGSFFGVAGNVLFELTPPAGGALPWPETVIQTVPQQSYGAGGFISDGHGGFFGLTSGNGAFGGGTLYQLTPAAGGWTFQTLLSLTRFAGNGSVPTGLVRDAQGALYGIVLGGYDVFKLSPPAGGSGWTQSVIHHFPNGSLNAALAIDKKGAIYGATSNRLFKLTPPKPKQSKWAVSTLFNFANKTKSVYGQVPSSVIVDSTGAAFGLTQQGGPNTTCGTVGCGTLFKLTPIANTNKYAISIVDSSGGTGGLINAPLIADESGTLYGMTGSNEFSVVSGQLHALKTATVFQVTGSGFQP